MQPKLIPLVWALPTTEKFTIGSESADFKFQTTLISDYLQPDDLHLIPLASILQKRPVYFYHLINRHPTSQKFTP